MDYLAEHRRILEQAVADRLPDQVDADSTISVVAVRELAEAGLLQAVDASSSDGDEYLEPRITVAGREYLGDLEKRAREASAATKARNAGLRVVDWAGGVAAGLLIAWLSKLL